jgi:hypothetical protein
MGWGTAVISQVAERCLALIDDILAAGETLLSQLEQAEGAEWVDLWTQRDLTFGELRALLADPGFTRESAEWTRIRAGLERILAQNDRIAARVQHRQEEVGLRLRRLEERTRLRRAYAIQTAWHRAKGAQLSPSTGGRDTGA